MMGTIANRIRQAIGSTAAHLATFTYRAPSDRTSEAYQSWLELFGGSTTASGISVSENSALNYSAVWAATCFYSSAFAALPLLAYRAVSDDDRARATDSPLWSLLKDQPNDEQDTAMFWGMQGPCLINWGNCYAEIERTYSGRIVGLWPIHASRVKPLRESRDGPVVYQIDEGRGGYIESADMWHIRGWISDDGVVGKGVIRQARESIALGMATENFGAQFFGNGARPSVVLTGLPQNLSEDGVGNIRAGWRKMHGSGNQQGVAVLRGDVKINTLSVPPEDAQFLGTRQHNITEIARWYRLPPHVLADLSRSTFSNIEQQNRDLLQYSLDPWLVRVEKAAKAQLLRDGDPTVYVEFLRDAWLRADTATRTESCYKQFMHGALTLNEWRRIENRNKIRQPWADASFVPNNLTPIDNIMRQTPEVEQQPASQSDDRTMAAALAVAEEAVHRMKNMQRNEIRRAAKVPGSYLPRLESWIGSHHATLANALERSWNLLAVVAGPADDREKVASDYCDWLRQAVIQSAEAPAAELEKSAELLCQWIETKPVNYGKYEVI